MSRAAQRNPPPLTFRFRNIGPVESAELELGDITIVAGRNNTGKTYLVYTLYGFLKTWEHWPGPAFLTTRTRASIRSQWAARYPTFEQISQQLAQTGQAELPLAPATLARERQDALKALTQRYSDRRIAAVFSSSPEEFENASLTVELPTQRPDETELPEAPAEPQDWLSIRYDGTLLSVVADQPGPNRVQPVPLRRSLWQKYLRFLLPDLPLDPFVLSAERFGISLFYRELDFRKIQLVELLQKYGDTESKDPDFPFHWIDETVSRYANPVRDNIEYTRSITDLRKQRSEIYDDGFFKGVSKMVGGYYAASNNAIEFRSARRNQRRFSIPLHLASSSARGLSDLYFFLRHVARRNHLLIIDEPESHLDTANQIFLARLLARLVRAGLKVILTTHSDYLIKELNNLIMLSASFDKKTKVLKRLDYARDDCIAPERVRAYIAAENGITRCEIDKFGIDMPHFDKTITEINDAANELASRLAGEEAE